MNFAALRRNCGGGRAEFGHGAKRWLQNRLKMLQSFLILFLTLMVAGRQRLCYTPPKSRRIPNVCATDSLWDFAQATTPGRYSGRIDVSEPASISTGIAQRYATALFDLAKEDNALPGLEADATALEAALAASPELSAMIASPILSRTEQTAAVTAIAAKMGVAPLMANTLALMGANRRLFVLPQFIANLRARISAEKGEVTAEVTAASVLSAAQSEKLAATLKAKTGKTVILKTTVDASLIGGLVVKLGSTMIDTSVKAKLAALQNAMKEVG